MIKKTHLLCVLFGSLWLLLGTIPAFGTHCCGFIDEKTIAVSPSMPGNTITNWLYASCYDIETLRPLDCRFTFKITGLKSPADDASNNGGHQHNFDTHPLIEPPSESLEYRYIFAGGTGPDKDPTPLGIDGQTQNDEAIIAHPLPQVAGVIMMEGVLTSQPGWLCASRCFTKESWKSVYTLNVGIQKLEPMPVSGEKHWRLTGAYGEPGVTSLHVLNNYGTSSTTGALSLIAWRYFEDTGGDSLGINDISLPKGGLFDINNDWARPHSEHRTGTDADIDRDEFNCEVDGLLWEAITFVNKYGYVAGGQPKADLLCESGGRKHIDFD